MSQMPAAGRHATPDASSVLLDGQLSELARVQCDHNGHTRGRMAYRDNITSRAYLPSHVDARSHAPVADRHTAPDGSTCARTHAITRTTHTASTARTRSGGHATPTPLQYSTASHALMPVGVGVRCRQIVVAGAMLSAGHSADMPVHVSAI
jgi:hypothetical protein